ncbi:MAG: cation-translocating P-type ATPase, partial [Leifsonia sp.]
SHLPSVVAEGRQVIANIERVSMIFLTKTVWATGLAVVFGLLVLPFPFLPRQLSIVDGLTIGIPSFFLALLPSNDRYRPGFLRRSLSFAIPTGIVFTLAFTFYGWSARALGIPLAEERSGATLVLTILALWVRIVISRPITAFKALVIGAMMIGLTLVYAVPFARDFLELTDLGVESAVLVLVTVVVSVALIEVVRFVHRRYLRRLEARTSVVLAESPTAPRA